MEKIIMWKATDGSLYETEDACQRHEAHLNKMHELRQKAKVTRIKRNINFLSEHYLKRERKELMLPSLYERKITIYCNDKASIITKLAELITDGRLRLDDVWEMRRKNNSYVFFVNNNVQDLDWHLSCKLEDCLCTNEYNGKITASLNAEPVKVI